MVKNPTKEELKKLTSKKQKKRKAIANKADRETR
jgi:hypothetical protein